MSSAPEPVESISAVTFVVPDMPAAVAFYEAIGFRLLFGGAREPFTTFAAGPGFVNLQLDADAAPRPRPEVWGRVVFWVDDVDAMHRRVLDAGYEPQMAPSDAPWGERYFHVRDPAGHELSFARLLA